MIFPALQPDQRDALPALPPRPQLDWRVQSPAMQVLGQEDEMSGESGGKLRSPNWSDVEVRFLIFVWKDHFPISKRHNSTVWERISKELNLLLREQNLSSVRTAQQCKAKIKNLEDEYKKVKDHNNRSGNDRINFPYFDDLKEVLDCKPRITPKKVGECGFEREASPCASTSSCSSTPSTSFAETLTETDDPDLGEPETDLSFSESLFFKRKPGSKSKKITESPSASSKRKPPVKKSKKTVRKLQDRALITSHF